MNEGRHINVTISTATISKTILLLLLLIVLYQIRDIVLVVLAAIVIASAMEPAANWCAKRHIKRLPAIIVMYLILGLLLAMFFIFFVPLFLNDAITYLNNLPDTINLNELWNPLRDSAIFSSGSPVDGSLADKSFSIRHFIDSSKYLIAGTGAGAFQTASLIFGGALGFILMIVLSFYLAVQEDGVSNFLRVITPVRRQEYAINLWKRSQVKIGYWMQGQLLLGLIVGVLTYLGLIFLGVKHALLLAAIAAVFELIPIFGPILSAVPAVLIAAVDMGLTQGFYVIILYLIIHQFENHLLYPMVVRKIVGISPIIVILALIIGAKLGGFLGAILSVPIASAFMEYIDDVEKDKLSEKLSFKK